MPSAPVSLIILMIIFSSSSASICFGKKLSIILACDSSIFANSGLFWFAYISALSFLCFTSF